MKQRFFISGCQRSGTTLLRLVLESHPHIQCYDESLGYAYLVDEAKGVNHELKLNEGGEIIGFKIPRFAEQLLWREFSDPVYGVFPSFYNGGKVIHLIRNPLDVVASMIRLKVSDGDSWIDLYGRSILQSMVMNPNISPRFKNKYKAIEEKGLPAHLIGALYWEIKNQGFIDLLAEKKPVYGVRYESLVEKPDDELKALCEFLDVEWDGSVLSHHKQSHSELDANGLAIGATDPCRSIDTDSIGGYKRTMTDKQIEEVELFVGEFSQQIKSILDKK